MYLDVTISVYLYLLSYFVSCICCLAYWQYDKQCVPRSKIISLFLLFTTVLPYALLCANRSEYTGYDTENYMIGYWNMKYGMGEITNSGFNYLFRIARYVTYIIFGDNVKIWLFFVAALPIAFVNYVLKKYAKNKVEYAFGCLFFLLYLSPIMMDQSRQFIAVGMTMLAFFYLQQKNTKRFLFWVFVAILFHESCLMLIMFLLLSNKKTVGNRLSAISPIVIVTISIFFIQYFMDLIYLLLPPKFAYIEEQNKTTPGSDGSGLGWLVDVTPMMFAMFIYYKYRKKSNLNNLPLEICALSALPFRLAGYSSYFVMRLSYYGEAVCIMLLLGVLTLMPRYKAIFWTFACLVVFFVHWYVAFVILSGTHAVIPYSFN
ncbi:EpsG family protein [Bacteroides oleiciplenus]|uniref:EpsG family protein n=1 Tax=Bacteroides oleiciplenus YIT 12058 TaxID=742727 RepID=K9EPI2_9BACE|nr:EpsG family protein [Bacteroides oleiciplenus]EKU92822.1 hypothetical protein HMPREF9447_00479 [Bacteroides oleiciplenus YIT 12058]